MVASAGERACDERCQLSGFNQAGASLVTAVPV